MKTENITQVSERDELLFIAMKNNISEAQKIEAYRDYASDPYAWRSARAYRDYAADCSKAISLEARKALSLRNS